ncbi:hypothetical protein DY000_02008100 [Brassica cretica]|uniref:Uncharacterized protein n=1 Tax=Brassica cretica TaxID=69181 RepID=A0ABQ7C868_BRACR|nr:hypothetical protein DY000_02008100 [Brassica cretica]
MRAESEAYKRWDFISEEKVLKQKSKMHWLNVGEKNNSVPRSNSKGNCKLHKGDRVCRWRDRDAPVRSHNLKTSVSWLKDMVKGIRKLRLNQNRCGASSLSLGQLTGADRQAHSPGANYFELAECFGPNQCGRCRAVTKPCRRLMWDDGAVCSQDRTKA